MWVQSCAPVMKYVWEPIQGTKEGPGVEKHATIWHHGQITTAIWFLSMEGFPSFGAWKKKKTSRDTMQN